MLFHEKDFDWITSNGGPLLMLPKDLLSKWHGIDRVFGTGAAPTDYERAGAIHRRFSPIEVGGGYGLVLGLPYDISATWWSDTNETIKNSFIVVRCLHTNSQDEIAATLRTLPRDIWSLMDFGFEVRADTLYILDSACRGTLINDYLDVKITPGTYTVEEAIYEPTRKPSRKLALELHRLTLVREPRE